MKNVLIVETLLEDNDHKTHQSVINEALRQAEPKVASSAVTTTLLLSNALVLRTTTIVFGTK